jgi:hypothetical protein
LHNEYAIDLTRRTPMEVAPDNPVFLCRLVSATYLFGKGMTEQTVQAIREALAGTILTKGAGFEFGALGFFQDKRDLLACDEREAFGFADVSHCCGPSRGW